MNVLNREERLVPAVLALANGVLFSGYAIGALGKTVGEIVFNTAMTGYQEILTDPSYAEQIVTLTCPHIGNVGTNAIDQESDRVWAAGLVIRELSAVVSNWRAQCSLSDYLKEAGVVAIGGIDTRYLTRLLREQGVQSGCIMTQGDAVTALAEARAYPGLQEKDLVTAVSARQITTWTAGTHRLMNDMPKKTDGRFHVVVYDLGIKQQILRLLVDHGCRVTVVPANTTVSVVMSLKPDGVVFSNGPGNPALCHELIRFIQQLLEQAVPIFGICLGFQLLALACGARTFKMKFGHHGANHPVKDLRTGRVFVTSQNHGFAVDEATLPNVLQITHRSLFDGTLQGFAHQAKPALAFQGHPEGSPGPHDIYALFQEFFDMMQRRATSHAKV